MATMIEAEKFGLSVDVVDDLTGAKLGRAKSGTFRTADVVGLDWTVNLGRARTAVGERVALQGNLDPTILFAPPAAVRAQAKRLLDSFGRPQRADGAWDGHIFNLGHGISQFTPPEHVAALGEAVHAHSRTLRAPAA